MSCKERRKNPTDGNKSHKWKLAHEDGNKSDSWIMEIKLRLVLDRELRNRKESIQDLAGKCKIPVSTLHNWSTGAALPSAKNLKYVPVLADYLGLTISELLFNVKENRPEASVLFSSMFVDDEKRYKLIIEKLPK